ncbi:antibiotic biosynthesis monooxygenase [Hymenobacter sp. HSC-4F20]|uniref:antibiotic biosynthesis monooxygenase n=1 Tax=Hymenobacter sp. HSC-4F20 TaxID=2864135 RepID=UPI001C734333|nr:antibiotic biosynthesis monooxygenase [Hymenobacter sp. HSC-4F20]MBX0289962.1 antibiotic biosynthesis monooxygenase [Hymenobacter sp. HSC-4F20]
MSSIITRIWHGRTPAHHAETYLQYLQESGIAEYKSTPGNLGVQVLRRVEEDVCHFWTISRWNSYESICRFAGAQYEQARYYPEDAQYLLEFEPTVQHFETFDF